MSEALTLADRLRWAVTNRRTDRLNLTYSDVEHVMDLADARAAAVAYVRASSDEHAALAAFNALRLALGEFIESTAPPKASKG